MSKKKNSYPLTRVCKPMPLIGTEDWVIWAAWADRITFEDIYKISSYTEHQVIRLMRKSLKPKSFKNWRKRVRHQSIKHKRLFIAKRQDYKRRRSWWSEIHNNEESEK